MSTRFHPIRLLLAVAALWLTGCVTAVDDGLPYDELPVITVATDVELIASPAHPTSFLPFDTVEAGSTVSLIGADEDAAWLLVLADNHLGWMPTIFSTTNVGNLRPAIVGEPLSGQCYQYSGVLSDINERWSSRTDGAALVVGGLYRPKAGDEFDGAMLELEIDGPGSAIDSDYVHTPLTPADALALFSFSLADLSAESTVRFALQGSGGETPAFQALFFEDVCRGKPAMLALGPFRRVLPSAGAASDAPVVAVKPETPIVDAEETDAGNATPTPVVLVRESEAQPTPTPASPVLVPEVPLNGNLALEETHRYQLDGYANTPVLFTIERTSGDLCYYLAVLDPYDETVESWGRFCDGEQRIPFTPPRTETLTLAVINERAGGDYSLVVDWLDAPPEQRNQDNEIEPGVQVSGKLGVGAWDAWTMEGFENTPLLWQVERTAGDLCYYVTIYDSLEEQLAQWGRYCGETQKFSFTPPRTESLTVQIYAERSYGSYALGVDWLNGPPDEDDSANTIVPGTAAASTLGVQAYDDYTLEAYENVPLLFSVERTRGDLCYYVNLLDAEGERLQYWGRYCSGQQRFAFTPPRTESLTVRVYADTEFGDYSLLIDWLDAPPEEREALRTLEPGAMQSGRLGIGAYDDFTFDGYENVPLLFTAERDRGELCYYVSIYDSDDERLQYWGRFCSGQQKFAFTPPRTEPLTVRVYADNDYGDYALTVDWLDTPPDERNLDIPLEPGVEQVGRLGIGAYDDYLFDGFRNTPILFTVERNRGELCYYLYVYDSEGEQRAYWGRYCSGQQKFAFTPPRTEPLTVRIYADNHYGDYLLEVDWLDAPPQERHQITDMESGVEHSGRLGVGSWDGYRFQGSAGQMMKLTVVRDKGDLCYYIYLFDSDDEQTAYWGRYCGGQNEIEYELPKSDTYILRIYADSNYGDYTLTLGSP